MNAIFSGERLQLEAGKMLKPWWALRSDTGSSDPWSNGEGRCVSVSGVYFEPDLRTELKFDSNDKVSSFYDVLYSPVTPVMCW